jgi:hypothetical protein
VSRHLNTLFRREASLPTVEEIAQRVAEMQAEGVPLAPLVDSTGAARVWSRRCWSCCLGDIWGCWRCLHNP